MPFKCKKCDKWHYTQEEMEAGALGGIAPEPAAIQEAPKRKKAHKAKPYGDPM
jgi:hypothetical protein